MLPRRSNFCKPKTSPRDRFTNVYAKKEILGLFHNLLLVMYASQLAPFVSLDPSRQSPRVTLVILSQLFIPQGFGLHAEGDPWICGFHDFWDYFKVIVPCYGTLRT